MKSQQSGDWNIRRKTLTLAVAPLVLITSLLTGYFIWFGQDIVRELFLSKGKDISRYLAKATEFQMFSGDTEALRVLGSAIVTENNVESVVFLDADGQILAKSGRTGPTAPISGAIVKRDSVWLFQQPVIYRQLEVDDYSDTHDTNTSDTEPATILGWVQVSISDKILLERQANVLYASLSIAIIGLLVTFFMAVRLGRGITRPLSRLSDTVKQLESGNLSARAPELQGHEFRTLATGLNQMAERIEHANEELKQRVDQATKQLTETLDNLEWQNHQLKMTRRELIAADRAKDEFLARMSHELRTPLTSILGYSELLKNEGLTDQQNEFNHIINQSSDLLLSTINDILDFTKLRSNAIKLEALPFNLESCLEDLVAMHAHAAFAKGLELVLIVESDVPTRVIGDTLRIRQIVNNLLSNAIKFTEQGQVVVLLSLITSVEDHATFNIQVKDSGIGISEEELTHLFAEFSQANSSITRRFGGSGLGLAIVKRLTQLMQGDIQLNSATGKGTEANCQIRLQLNLETDHTPTAVRHTASRLLICDQNPWALRGIRHLALQWSSQLVTLTARADLWKRISAPDAEFDALVIGLMPAEVTENSIRALLTKIRLHSDAPLLLVGGTVQASLQGNAELWHRYQPLIFISKPPKKQQFLALLGKLTGADEQTSTAIPTSTNDSPPLPRALLGASILIAEDNRYNRELITRFLTAAGASVMGAENGSEAVQLFKEQGFDILLLDFNMPELGGIEAARIIRASNPPANVKLFALTAAVVNEQYQTEDLQLFDGLINKPVGQEELVHTLAEHWSTAAAPNLTGRSLFKVSAQQLNAEVARLAANIADAESRGDREAIKTFAHQLRGILDPQYYEEITNILSLLERVAEEADTVILSSYVGTLLELLAACFNHDH